MGLLRASGGNQWTQNTAYSGLQIQSTSSALPVPIAYGRNTVSPNVIWYNGFGFYEHKSGKGGGWTAEYYADIIMGLCEGPISGVGTVWQTSTIGNTLAGAGWSLATGGTPQTEWSYLATKYPAQALAYNGTAYVYASTFFLGSAATIGDNIFEVFGILAGSGFNAVDADPALVVYDVLTNSQYGVGFPAASISADALYNASYGYQTYCKAIGVAFSPVLNNQEKASSILTRWLQITNSTAIWSDGMLKIIPFGDGVVSGNGVTFTPNSTALYSLTDEDFVASPGEDPVQISRANPYALANWQAVEIKPRSDNYNTGPILAFDQSMIDQFGLRVGSTVTAHEICDVNMARIVAQLILQRGLYVRNNYKFRLSEEFCMLEPMDLVQLTDPALGLNATTVRIVEIEEDDLGVLSVTAEDYLAGVATAVAYPTQTRSHGAPSVSPTPNAINAPLIIEPPSAVTGDARELWIGASPQGADPMWGGCFIWASYDGTTYSQIGAVSGAAAQGVLSAALPAFSGANPDGVHTLAVSLLESGGTLTSTTAANAAAGASLCYVGGEYLSFATATLTAANQYNLTGLFRGQGGSVASGANVGAAFCLLDGKIFKFGLLDSQIGQTIYLKFQSFNIYGDGLQALSNCTAYPYVITGAGALGPVAATLSVGSSVDFGDAASGIVAETDDFGSVGSNVVAVIDLGGCNPSDNLTSSFYWS